MKSRAFTLIELLVVVLIIGILSAIALPQYQKAVTKSRYASLKVLTRAIADAEKVYYLANGSYTNNFDDLDVQLPPHISEGITTDESGENVTRITRTFDWGYCYLQGGHLVRCRSDLADMRYGIDVANGTKMCLANNTDINSVQNQICKAETGKSTYTKKSDKNTYIIWNY